MSTKNYHISAKGEEQENLSLDALVEMLANNEVMPTDFYMCEESGDWQMLMENTDIMQALKEKTKPKKVKASKKISAKKEELKEDKKVDQKEGQKTDSEKSEKDPNVEATDFSELPNNPMLSEWYVLKGENKFGPFQYTDVIKMLQEKVIFEFDFAWQNGMESWVRIAEIKDFCPEHIKRLQDGLMPEIKNVFFRRKHPRVPFKCSVIVHDNANVWQGQAVELSEGGAGLIMENSLIVPGQKLYMHFKSEKDLPAFNAICEVVSKKYVDGVKKKQAPICYGVKFMNLTGDTHQFLQKYTKLQVEQAA